MASFSYTQQKVPSGRMSWCSLELFDWLGVEYGYGWYCYRFVWLGTKRRHKHQQLPISRDRKLVFVSGGKKKHSIIPPLPPLPPKSAIFEFSMRTCLRVGIGRRKGEHSSSWKLPNVFGTEYLQYITITCSTRVNSSVGFSQYRLMLGGGRRYVCCTIPKHRNDRQSRPAEEGRGD